MSLSEKLLKQAAAIRASSSSLVALDMLKQAGVSEDLARAEVAQSEMEKSAASTLSQTGIDYDEALKLVKNAGVKLTEMANYQPTKSVEEELWESLTKMASEAKALEDELGKVRVDALGYSARVESLEKVAERREDTTDPVARLAQSGDFTNADLEALLKLGPETLTKVASMADGAQPWAMGRVSGQGQAEPIDALEAFCNGSF
jgi:hypothetical protein